MEERLQKLIAAAGICSRRAAEELVLSGRVTLNGKTAALGEKADLGRDVVLIDGRAIGPQEKPVYLMLNKPRGYVTTLCDEQGRPTVADLVRDVGVRVFPVGRLDRDSEGLLVLTNDGELAQHLLHPSHKIDKTYHVTVAGNVENAVRNLSAVTDVGGEAIAPAQVSFLRRSHGSVEMAVTIHQGKKRQIRRMCAECDLRVERLQRVREHTLELGELPLGQWRFLTAQEVAALRRTK